MTKQKKLNKKIRRLEAEIQENTRKLARLRHKAATAAEGRLAKGKGKSTVRAKLLPKTAKAPARKRKSGLTPEGRAKLAALMQARWAAKRAAAAATPPPREGVPHAGR